ncbi:PH domain-containing protein [Haloarchaeobius sp. TZWWS8]|uniref:PH domain-containing protein n=1 Tax=Haloarchaeobius sp. TZWWS8 TaxID=3446121 RepID=UPI003EBE61B0
MTEDWLTLDDGEEVLWSASPRIQSVLPAAVLGLVVALGAVALVTVAELPTPLLAVALLGLGPPLLAYFYVINTRYVVTNQGCYRKTGGLSRRVISVDFESVQNSSYEQGILGTQFGYGSVTVDTAGGLGQELVFWNVDDPRAVQKLLSEQRARHDEPEIPGTLAQWQAIRDEVRVLRRLVERTYRE